MRWRAGDTLTPLHVGPVTRATLALFAGASGDHNPIHIDIDAAKAAGFDDVFAHGMLSMAHLGRLVAGIAGPQAVRRLDARFTAITPVHARPTCEGEVLAVDETTQGQLLSLGLRVVLDNGTVTIRGTAQVAIPNTTTSEVRPARDDRRSTNEDKG